MKTERFQLDQLVIVGVNQKLTYQVISVEKF